MYERTTNKNTDANTNTHSNTITKTNTFTVLSECTTKGWKGLRGGMPHESFANTILV